MTLYEKAVAQMDTKDIDHWQSDLYLRKNPISNKLVAEYEYPRMVSMFRDNIDHELWYEINFAYHEKRGKSK